MTEQQTEILSTIFKSFSVQTIKNVTELTEYNNDLLAKFEKTKSIKASETLAFIDNIIDNFQLENEKIKEKNKTHSVLFNPLTFFPIGETMHSFLIANLIDPNAEHGQGNLFLKSFLKLLDIEVFENDNWIVTAETGRIDILIKRQNPHTVIVIENKSNYAIDQENQIYRYWYQEIYTTNKKQIKPIDPKNYRIIYLTPAEWKIPNEYSLSKPKNQGYEDDLPITVPITPEIWLFNVHLKKWLTHSLEELHEENHRLREYIKQYIELWT
jgi:hypothetical protein